MSSPMPQPPSFTAIQAVSAGSQIHPFILNGQPHTGKPEHIMPIYYPGDQTSLIGECHAIDASNVEAVCQAAQQGFQSFRHCPPRQRVAILRYLAQNITHQQEALALLITHESGKPISLSRQEVQRSIQLCYAYANELERTPAEQILHLDARQVHFRRFAIGPVLAITPFNFPLNLIMHKLAPAIAAGCAITIKPAPQTPFTALKLAQLALEAGYEAISVVPTANPNVIQALVAAEGFSKISFTGSAPVGWQLRALAGKKDVTLELGGNAAVIIEELTEPVETLAKRVAFGAFAFAGQICIAVQRIFIHQRLQASFVPALVQAARAMRVGDPLLPDTEIGPMISIEAVQRSRQLIKNALQQGANVVYGGNTYNALTLNPTLLDRTTPEMAVNADEVFAPIATITPYTRFEEALTRVNQSRFGLQAGIYTHNRQQMEQAYQTLEVGAVIINDIPTYRSDILPYGGIKDSGIGQEGVMAGIDAYTHTKLLIHRD